MRSQFGKRLSEAVASHPVVVALGLTASLAGLFAVPFLWGNPSPYIDPEIRAATDAYPSPFTITNKSGWFDITELRVSCHQGKVDYGNPNYDVENNYSFRVFDLATTIKAGDHATFACLGIWDFWDIAPVISGTINLEISYKMRWRFLSFTRRFTAKETYSRGKWIDGPII